MQKEKMNTHLGFIMAVPTIKDFITTRSPNLASPSVMCAPNPHQQKENPVANQSQLPNKIQSNTIETSRE